ncbi:hypothetical protein CXB51_035129 [Gossypium anomalum]|uniref:Uncharacterized protein n=1 Tax=Gossypium anomalum TaxID=47600 RepID=A0A8J5Y2C8_9ROSI|nr:hypothetical protein CXB51_035129 [Gossypium anomalum]
MIWTILKDNVVVPVVQEFYASLRDQESRNIEGHIWDTVPVRGKEVQVSPRIICDFYNATYYGKDFIDETDLEYFQDIGMDNIINFLIEGRGKWKYRPERVGVYTKMDPQKHEKMYKWLESWSFLSPLSDGLMQKGRCTYGIH